METTRSATYKNIPAGDYTFMVKSSNNDGIWNNTPTTLKIKIQPAWWSTKMAIVSYCLMVLLLGYFIYKFLNTRIEEKRILQLERQEYKQFEALNAKKIQFLHVSCYGGYHEKDDIQMIYKYKNNIVRYDDFKYQQ